MSAAFAALLAIAAAALLLALFWLVAALHLRGPDLATFDRPAGQRLGDAAPSSQLQDVLGRIGALTQAVQEAPRARRIQRMRQLLDELPGGRAFDARFVPVDCEGVAAEWVLAPGADGARRMLYIHGGGWTAGSARSHRTLTTRLAAIIGGAVLAIDYRLMPEHPRRAGIEDCRSAWRWLIANGPDGAQAPGALFVAGDSAGGNLALSLIAWVRDQGLRAPDAVVAFSPATDATSSSPSLRANLATDPMLGPLFAPLTRMPRALLLWTTWLANRINPRDPRISPVFGNLAGLPPVLVQASRSEMLLDDARRWVNRARAAGSPARLQVWDHMPHVWPIFNPELPEAEQALAEVGKFLAEHGGPSTTP